MLKLIKHFIHFLFLLTCLFFVSYSQEKSVCFSFDDLTGTHGALADHKYIIDKLLESLDKYEVPAIGFVNEYKLYDSAGSQSIPHINLLLNWINNDHELGNHTFSHAYIDRISLDEYKMEVIKGEKIIRKLLETNKRKLEYFRHTQLRTGPTEAYRIGLNTFLDSLKYRVAPVTMDNDEYIFAYCYFHAYRSGDNEIQNMVKREYITYMKEVVAYYEKLSYDFLGYYIPHILLLHANHLNADCLEEIIHIFDSNGYEFVTIKKALEDPAYKHPEKSFTRGLSWIHRWMIVDGLDIPEPPEVNNKIIKLFQSYR